MLAVSLSKVPDNALTHFNQPDTQKVPRSALASIGLMEELISMLYTNVKVSVSTISEQILLFRKIQSGRCDA